MIIHSHIIMLYMHYYHIKKLKDLDTFLACYNWPILLKKVEKKYLTSSKVADICQKKGVDSAVEVARRLLVHKYEFEVKYIDIYVAKYSYKRIPN